MGSFEQIGLCAPIGNTRFEVVERKGIGHPDTLADGAAEAASIALVSYWLENYGGIPYYNLDHLLLSGGEATAHFGGGRIVNPTKLYLGGHVSLTFAGQDTDSAEIALKGAEQYVRATLPGMPDEALVTESLTTGSTRDHVRHNPRNLSDMPDTVDPTSNDTSTTVSHWPLSTTEKLALILEGYFYDENGRPRFDQFGQDIKVTTRRLDNIITVATCVPVLSGCIENIEEYHEQVLGLQQELTRLAEEFTPSEFTTDITVNSALKPGQVGDGYYILNYGSCIEMGEEGAVGRGNKQHGIIPTMRPMSMEAPAGKCTANFTGKLGTLYATEIAKRLSAIGDGADVQVAYSANMGDRLKDPSLISILATVPLGRSVIRRVIDEVFAIDHVDVIQSGYFLPRIGIPSEGASVVV